MDSSCLPEAQQKDGQVIQPNDYQKTEDEIAEAEDKTEETGNKTGQQTETITSMGYELYWAAESGDISAVLKEKDHLQSLLTPNKNTILHIYITSRTTEDPDPTMFVKKILENCPALLMQPNTKNETPLHIAARYGHASIVETLIQHAKDLHPENLERGVEAAREMMRMCNQNQDTAFHEAVRFNHLRVVEILFNEDCDLVCSANEEHETPLYMAAERGYRDIVFKMLEKCKKLPPTGGPNGRNVLHAATIRKDEEMIKKILGEEGETEAPMLEEADEIGWTPLHHAAYMGYLPAVQLFLNLPIGREKVAYRKDKLGNTALHLAVELNHESTIVEIINWCPECCELVNGKGWNIFHTAMQNNDLQRAMDDVLKKNAFSNLLNEKDANGNTPLHHIAISLNSGRLGLIDHPRVDKMAFNKQNQNALDLASTSTAIALRKKCFIRRLQKLGLRLGIRIKLPILIKLPLQNEEEDSTLKKLDKAQDTNLIVAALIATVTFTAGFTVPGGFFSEKGPLQALQYLEKAHHSRRLS